MFRLSILFLIVLASQVRAQTNNELKELCNSAGELALLAATARDAGLPADELENRLRTAEMDDDTKSFLATFIALPYLLDGVEGPLMKQVALQMCHKKAGLE